MIKKSLLVCGVLFAAYVHANDSTGYVAAGGVQYIKNDKIAMHSEELYVSKDLIKVDYQFKKPKQSRHHRDHTISVACCSSQ